MGVPVVYSRICKVKVYAMQCRVKGSSLVADILVRVVKTQGKIWKQRRLRLAKGRLPRQPMHVRAFQTTRNSFFLKQNPTQRSKKKKGFHLNSP